MIRRQQVLLKRQEAMADRLFKDIWERNSAGFNAQLGDWILGGVLDDVALGVGQKFTIEGLGWSETD